MNEWRTIVILLCVLLLGFLLWKEIKRANKHLMGWRMAATIAAVASLACIALPLTYHTIVQQQTGSNAIVLTGGFSKDSVNALLEKHPGIPVFFFDKHIPAQLHQSQYIPDVSLLPLQYKNIHVFGYGFSKEEINNLHNQSIIFHPSIIAAGITAVHWQQRLQTGDKLIVQGTYHNTSSNKIKMVLSSYNTSTDSVVIAATENQVFTLVTFPKNIGRTTYTLAVVSGKDTIEKETVPVQVEEGKRLRILMLASAPGFDNKFLKDALSNNNYTLATRTIISKDKYAFDYINTAALSVQHITAALLDKFDVVVAGATALAAMPVSESAALQSAISHKGLGLVVKADSLTPNAFYAAPFAVNSSGYNTLQPLTTYLIDTSEKLPVLITDYPLVIRNQANTQPLVFDKQNKVYAGTALYGMGKIVFTTFTNTYTWALAGDKEMYNKYWAALLNNAAPKLTAAEAWSIAPALPVVDAPVQLQVETNNSGIPQATVNGAVVYLAMNADLPYQWSGTYYPAKPGWQTAVALNGNPFYWYVYSTTDWQNVYRSQKILATQQYIASHLRSHTNTGTGTIAQTVEFPKIYWYMLFLAACGFLWFENKYILSKGK